MPLSPGKGNFADCFRTGVPGGVYFPAGFSFHAYSCYCRSCCYYRYIFLFAVFGFTINLLTLFALVLAIGIVVDDAIVVVEAVHTKMERTNLPARKATIESMNEISGAIISITLVMAAVFIPVGFMQGPAGVFYKQFAFTLAIAIFISAVNALTLSPALCALFLKNPHSEEENGHIPKKDLRAVSLHGLMQDLNAMTNRYIQSLDFLSVTNGLLYRDWYLLLLLAFGW